MAPRLFPEGRAFALDFHTIPFRGDPTALDNHYLPRRGKAGPSVLSFFAQEQESRVVCYANANLTRADQSGELMRFVEFWHEVTGSDPQWLYFDSKVVDYPELSRVNAVQDPFRHDPPPRGGHPPPLERSAGHRRRRAVIDIPKRRHKNIRYLDETVKIRGYSEKIRQSSGGGIGT